MALATAKITELIDKIIEALNTADIEGIVGVYFGDQEAFSAYPVICVGSPPLLNEEFPVMAKGGTYDEIYSIPIITYVKYADTLANNKQIYDIDGAIKSALRANYFSDYVYFIDIIQTRYVYAKKPAGGDNVRVAETTIRYTKRIS